MLLTFLFIYIIIFMKIRYVEVIMKYIDENMKIVEICNRYPELIEIFEKY